MNNKKMPLEGLIILKRLNTKEDVAGVSLKDIEYVFASKLYPEIIRTLARYPANRLDWLIVAKFKQTEDGQLEYSNGVSGTYFLKQAQKHFDLKICLN